MLITTLVISFLGCCRFEARCVWGWSSVRAAGYSSLTAPNLQPTANQERNDQCGNLHFSSELLMMGTVVPETCWAYKKYNKIISIIQLVFIFQLSQWCTVQQTSKLIYIYIYTGCPRRNVPDFGGVFLMLNYTDITLNTYVQSWTVTEIMPREKCGLHWCRRTVRRPWRHTCPIRLPDN